MSNLTPEIAAEIIAACRAGADEIAASFARAFEGQLTGIDVGESATHDAATLPEGFDGPGLAVVLKFGDEGALALLPESSGLVPEWCAQPDITGKSKLTTLAQELGMLLVPETFVADEFHAVRVEHLANALSSAEVSDAAAVVPLALKSEAGESRLSFIWPVANPQALVATAPPKSPAAPPAPEAASTRPAAPPVNRQASEPEMPGYMKSFLKIEVPLSVHLASQKQSVHDILALVPGSIIKFDKSCDEMLDLVVGDQPIAEGEVVKVGDKFGLRIRGMILPHERFVAVKAALGA